MALCRWQTEESLAIYARLGEADYTRLLERSLQVRLVNALVLPGVATQPGGGRAKVEAGAGHEA